MRLSVTFASLLLLLLAVPGLQSCWGFQVVHPTTSTFRSRSSIPHKAKINGGDDDEGSTMINGAVNGDIPNEINGDTTKNDDVVDESMVAQNSRFFEGVEMLDFILENHKPLGCTVEESLASEEDGKTQHVFIVKVVEGGNAERAGLQVGDVLAGVTGTFGKVMPVAGMGLEHVKSLVSACHKDEPLELCVARGTDVMERHETALVDLCTLGPGSANDKEVENCVKTIHTLAYSDLDDAMDDSQSCEDDDEDNCLLDSMFDMWAEDLPEGATYKNENGQFKEDETAMPINGDSKPAPWSSRSSPSGTYVRDPATGEMKNIG